MNEKQITQISKFLSMVLRHQPETIGIELDPNGWTDVDTLIVKSNGHGIEFDKETLIYIVATNSKKRFAFNDTLDKIRASQGHSVNIELGYTAQKPPQVLYHGTSKDAVPSIMKSGLEKRSRHHVHLSSDAKTAATVGQRHGKPFVFIVLAEQMANDNFDFYLSDNDVWLTDNVPVMYLKQMTDE